MGNRNSGRRFSDRTVALIRDLAREGMSASAIARQLKLSRKAVAAYVRSRSDAAPAHPGESRCLGCGRLGAQPCIACEADAYRGGRAPPSPVGPVGDDPTPDQIAERKARVRGRVDW